MSRNRVVPTDVAHIPDNGDHPGFCADICRTLSLPRQQPNQRFVTQRAMMAPGRIGNLRAAIAAHGREVGGTHALQALPLATSATGLQAALDELGISLTRHQVRAAKQEKSSSSKPADPGQHHSGGSMPLPALLYTVGLQSQPAAVHACKTSTSALLRLLSCTGRMLLCAGARHMQDAAEGSRRV